MSEPLNRLIDLHTARQHHTALRLLIAELPQAEPFDANVARTVLTRLSTVLVMHLRLEDRNLYPALMSVADSSISRLACRYRDEMSGLSSDFLQFESRWRDVASIAGNPALFLVEWSIVQKLLNIRMQHEDCDLYPEAEKFFRAQTERTG